MRESSYIDCRGKAQIKLDMSEHLALSAGMAYDPNTRDAVQNAMYQLQAYIVQTPHIVTPALPTIDNLQPIQPVADQGTYISQAKAEEITQIPMDGAMLVKRSMVHGYPIEYVDVDGVSTPTYHAQIYAIAYDIPVHSWGLHIPVKTYIE
jgi:hypothetical protein